MTTETFAVLAINAANNTSRRVAHRASRAGQVLKTTGASNLDDARGRVERLKLDYARHSARYDSQVAQRSALLAELAGLEMVSAESGTKNGEQIARIKTALDKLESSITNWSAVEPELLCYISQAEGRAAEMAKESQLAEIALLVDEERGRAVKLYETFETMVYQVAELQRLIEHKTRLQAGAGVCADGLSQHSVVMPTVGDQPIDEREKANRFAMVKRQLFASCAG